MVQQRLHGPEECPICYIILALSAAEEGSKFRGSNELRRKFSMLKIKSYGRLLK